MTASEEAAAGWEGIAYLFPGQGSQAVGMGVDLCRASAVARVTLQEADDALGAPLSRLCAEGPADELTDTVNAQPALLAVSVAAWRVAGQRLGRLPEPEAVAGHSMGEYSALVAAQSLSYPDGLRLVRTRGRLMKDAGDLRPGRMAAVLGMDRQALATLCREVTVATGQVVQIANDNHPSQQVISGSAPGVEEASRLAPERGARRVMPLAVSIAAHSPLMADARPALEAAIDKADVRDPVVPVIGNTCAYPLIRAEDVRRELSAQLEGGVRWRASMQALLEMGVTTFVEFGSGTVLSGIMRKIDRRARCFALRTLADIDAWGEWLQERQRLA